MGGDGGPGLGWNDVKCRMSSCKLTLLQGAKKINHDPFDAIKTSIILVPKQWEHMRRTLGDKNNSQRMTPKRHVATSQRTNRKRSFFQVTLTWPTSGSAAFTTMTGKAGTPIPKRWKPRGTRPSPEMLLKGGRDGNNPFPPKQKKYSIPPRRPKVSRSNTKPGF